MVLNAADLQELVACVQNGGFTEPRFTSCANDPIQWETWLKLNRLGYASIGPGEGSEAEYLTITTRGREAVRSLAHAKEGE